MKFGRAIEWEQVFSSWRGPVPAEAAPNADVWGALPPGVAWFECEIETCDLARLFVIGSPDWQETFGTHALAGIATSPLLNDDRYHHRERILGIASACARGRIYSPPIITAHSGHGPFVIIDGNHRAVALQRLGLLLGQRVYLGCHPQMGQIFQWFRWAFCPPRPQGDH